MTSTAVGQLSVCCMSGGHNPGRLAAILALFGDVADEIVVAVEEPRALVTHEAVAHVADIVRSFPPTEPCDRPIPWLFGLCSGKWILNIDDDEVPSPELIERLPGIIARKSVTHGWIARRWLYPSTNTYLAEPPWSTEFQLRLFLADERFVQFSDVFHRPVVAHGPGLFIDAPLWHLDTAVNPVNRRRLKADAYERARPGMKIEGRAHNHAFYLPELVPNAAVAAVPGVDASVIDAVLAGSATPTRQARAHLGYASDDEVGHVWPGPPHADTLHRGRLAVPALPAGMRAGVQETIDAYVTNESTETWRFGKEARPEIRLGYHWSLDRKPVDEPKALRTPLPSDLHPGETQFVPVHVVPPVRAGRYALQIDILHEGFGCFRSTLPAELEVRERQLLAVVGLPDSIMRTLERVAPSPEIEPVVVLGNGSDRSAYGDHHSVPGLRQSLLAGLECSGRLTRSIRLLSRSLSIIRQARRYHRTGITHDARLGDLFELLAHSQTLIVAGTDWPEDAAPGREWWRLVTTMRVARAIDVPVFVARDVVPHGSRPRRALLSWLIARCSNPLDDGAAPRQPPGIVDSPVVGAEPAEEIVVAAF